MSRMQGLTKEWVTPPVTDPLKPIVGRILDARGITSKDEAQTFLDPKLSALEDPYELPNAKKQQRFSAKLFKMGKKS